MAQILQILCKDLRRLRIDLAIGLGTLVLLTWTEWHHATPTRVWRSYFERYYETLAVGIVVLGWWVMVVRLIQGDALVGDRQFWVTRPYVWYKLLTAKVLFIVICIAPPLFLSHVVLLYLNDAHQVISNLGTAVSDTAGAMLVAILPVVAIAAITPNFRRWVMGASVVIALAFGMVWLDTKLIASHVPTGTNLADVAQAVVAFCLLATGIVFQYAKRHTRAGIIAICAVAVALPVIVLAMPYAAIIHSAYPIAAVDSRLKLTLLPEFVFSRLGIELVSTDDERPISITLPIQISGMQGDTTVIFQGAMLSGSLPGGHPWTSQWQSTPGNIFQDGSVMGVSIRFPRELYERVKALSSPMRLSIALTQLKARNHIPVTVAPQFEVPGVGSCWLGILAAIECRSSANAASRVMATFGEEEKHCQSSEFVLRLGLRNSTHSLGSQSALGPLSPLLSQKFWGRDSLCPGSQVVFSSLEETGRVRFELSLGSLRLRDYARDDSVLELRVDR